MLRITNDKAQGALGEIRRISQMMNLNTSKSTIKEKNFQDEILRIPREGDSTYTFFVYEKIIDLRTSTAIVIQEGLGCKMIFFSDKKSPKVVNLSFKI